jgi:hypothetical protein
MYAYIHTYIWPHLGPGRVQGHLFQISYNVVVYQESEETMTELKNVYEREKLMLMEENKRFQFDLERTAELNNRLQVPTIIKRFFRRSLHSKLECFTGKFFSGLANICDLRIL